MEVGQRAFWLWVNSTGGIGGYSVAITEGQDTAYNPQKHLEGYNAIRNDVAALAVSLEHLKQYSFWMNLMQTTWWQHQ